MKLTKEQRKEYYALLRKQRIGGIHLIIAAILLLNGAAGASIIVGPLGLWLFFSKEVLL